jgi:hypothetical protein
MAKRSALIGVRTSLARGERELGMIGTVMEAARDMPYCLAWQGMLRCKLLSTPVTAAFGLIYEGAIGQPR